MSLLPAIADGQIKAAIGFLERQADGRLMIKAIASCETAAREKWQSSPSTRAKRNTRT